MNNTRNRQQMRQNLKVETKSGRKPILIFNVLGFPSPTILKQTRTKTRIDNEVPTRKLFSEHKYLVQEIKKKKKKRDHVNCQHKALKQATNTACAH